MKLTLPGGPATKVPGTSKDVPPLQPPAHVIFITTDSADVGQMAPHCSKLTGTVSQQEKQRSTPSQGQLIADFLQVVELSQAVAQESVRIALQQQQRPSLPVAPVFSLLSQHKFRRPFFRSPLSIFAHPCVDQLPTQQGTDQTS